MKMLLKLPVNAVIPAFVDQILVSETLPERSDLTYFSSLDIKGTQSCVFADTIADCMNAELDEKKIIIWKGENPKEIEALSPKKVPYGWMLLSTTLPIYIQMSHSDDLQLFENVDYQGIYSEKLDVLENIRKILKME